MNNRLSLVSILFLGLLIQTGEGWGAEYQSRYVTLSFSDMAVLRDFNENLSLDRKLSYSMQKKNVVTVTDEVLAKVDIIIEKTQVVLDMFPNGYHIQLILLPDVDAVSQIYKAKYGKHVDHIAYYSLSEKTIYVSVEDTRLQVLAHEIAHSVVDYYFKVRPPYNIHELMAQFAEKHITD
ncbi:MAG: hypothetical protein Q7U88_02390 [Desulfocapsaceae bacterium]|nr:hypothetical protein [Desulfocapsaceae bacterium]